MVAVRLLHDMHRLHEVHLLDAHDAVSHSCAWADSGGFVGSWTKSEINCQAELFVAYMAGGIAALPKHLQLVYAVWPRPCHIVYEHVGQPHLPIILRVPSLPSERGCHSEVLPALCRHYSNDTDSAAVHLS